MTRTLGAILAGGQSRRFGSDKALASYQGATLLDRIVATLGPQVEALVICGRRSDTVTALPDFPGPGRGPLAGLAAALHYAVASGFDAVVSVPCDTPVLPDDLVARLSRKTASYVAAIPVIGCWPAALARQLDLHLATDGKRSMRGWIEAIGAVSVDLGAIANINTPDDLAALSHGCHRAMEPSFLTE